MPANGRLKWLEDARNVFIAHCDWLTRIQAIYDYKMQSNGRSAAKRAKLFQFSVSIVSKLQAMVDEIGHTRYHIYYKRMRKKTIFRIIRIGTNRTLHIAAGSREKGNGQSHHLVPDLCRQAEALRD